jgi:multidrug efflux system outer membrane protein
MAVLCLSLCLASLLSPAFAEAADSEKDRTLLKLKTTQWREVQTAPEAGESLQGGVSRFPDRDWWQRFNDPHLNTVIEAALAANHQLAMAEQRVLQARALARESLGRELPQLGLNPSFTRQKNSQNLIAPNQNQFAGAGPRLFAPGATFNLYNVPLQASYEVDLFLRNRDRTRSANQQVKFSEQQAKTAIITVTTETASAYFNLLKADRLIQLQHDVIALAQDAVSLEKSRFDVGLVSWENVSRAQAFQAQAEAALPEYERLRSVSLDQLAVLTARTPLELATLARTPLENLPIAGEIAVGVPSELLTRRPDILAAEADLERARIDVRIARKAFLPTLNLTGQFGFATTRLNNLFDWQSHLAAFTASMTQSLFTGGQRLAGLRYQKAVYQERLHGYQQTLLQAFQEVEDSLASLKAHQSQLQANQQRTQAEGTTVQLVEERYTRQLSNYRDVVDARQSLIAAQTAEVESRTAILNDTLSLYRALGGGF